MSPIRSPPPPPPPPDVQLRILHGCARQSAHLGSILMQKDSTPLKCWGAGCTRSVTPKPYTHKHLLPQLLCSLLLQSLLRQNLLLLLLCCCRHGTMSVGAVLHIIRPCLLLQTAALHAGTAQ